MTYSDIRYTFNGGITLQKEIRKNLNIFESDGKVMSAGWAKSPVFIYNKENSKVLRGHSQRDCYFISNDEVSLYLSVENLSNEFSIKIAIADLKRGGVICDYISKKVIFSRHELPESEIGSEMLYTDNRVQLQMTNTVDGKLIKCDFIDFGGSKNLYFNINLKVNDYESLNMLAPFERNRKYFYLKRFAPNYIANGIIKVGGMEYGLNEITSRAYFDWTRFSKPRKHNYQRLSADCIIDEKRFSLLLASRVGDNRYGNENCFFMDGNIQKLSQINVNSTNGRIDRPWFFKGGISAFDINFKPFTVRKEPMTAVMGKTMVLFGRLYGQIKHINYDTPIVVDNALAHMVFTEF